MSNDISNNYIYSEDTPEYEGGFKNRIYPNFSKRAMYDFGEKEIYIKHVAKGRIVYNNTKFYDTPEEAFQAFCRI